MFSAICWPLVRGYQAINLLVSMTGETIPKPWPVSPLSCLTVNQAKSWFLAGWPRCYIYLVSVWAKPLWLPSLRPSPYSHGHWSHRKLYQKNVHAYRTFKAPLNPVLTQAKSKYLTALTRSCRSAQLPRYDTLSEYQESLCCRTAIIVQLVPLPIAT